MEKEIPLTGRETRSANINEEERKRDEIEIDVGSHSNKTRSIGLR